MDLEIDRPGQLSYFLCDPLSDLRDLCVNLSRVPSLNVRRRIARERVPTSRNGIGYKSTNPRLLRRDAVYTPAYRLQSKTTLST